ncbi:MAG: hypothetical protein R3311_16000, partial [Oceanisphaera sp.]|nr:hypothetical protein [Oceanisphaera sp.]
TVVPPVLGFGLLAGVFALARAAGSGIMGRAAAGLLLLSAPAVLIQSSEYYVDVALAAYVIMALVMLYRVLMPDRKSSGVPAVVAGGVLLGCAVLIKKLGLVVLGFPVLLAVIAAPLRREQYVRLAAVFSIATALALPYLVRIPALPPFPAAETAIDWQQYLQAFMREGFGNLFVHSVNINSAVVLLLIILLVARACRPDGFGGSRYTLFLLAAVLLWFLAVSGGIYMMNRLDYFNRWGRYCLPAYSICCVLVVCYAAGLREAPLRWRSGGLPQRVGLLACAVAAVYAVTLTPWEQLNRIALNRFGYLSTRPLTAPEIKQKYAYREAYGAWQHINRIAAADAGGRVLAEDARFYYLEPLTYDFSAVPPHTHTVAAMHDWLREHNVRWIIACDRVRDFDRSDLHRNTNFTGLLSSDRVDLSLNGSYRVYTVKDTDN